MTKSAITQCQGAISPSLVQIGSMAEGTIMQTDGKTIGLDRPIMRFSFA